MSLFNIYYTTNAGMHCAITAIAFGTATTSSELKQCIQPIMDGHAPTTVNIEWGSIVLFHISQDYHTTNAGMHCRRCGLQRHQMCIQPIMDGEIGGIIFNEPEN